MRRGHGTLTELRAYIDNVDERAEIAATQSENGKLHNQESVHQRYLQPRWVRVNTLKTNVQDQLASTFADYQAVDVLDDVVLKGGSPNATKLVHIDRHIPNLLAFPHTTDLTKTRAYLDGMIILQDKASCFPAYMLNVEAGEECLDACAAPGNKTTHLAAIMHERNRAASRTPPKMFAIERDPNRMLVLRTMVSRAGASARVQFYENDFLKRDPNKPPCSHVHAVLLDPSCSGSGIVNREGILNVTTPRVGTELSADQTSKRKRKRRTLKQTAPTTSSSLEVDHVATKDEHEGSLNERLAALSAFQLRLLLHAFQFPKAQKITYSTCSIYTDENEKVVIKALLLSRDKGLCWRILRRTEQIGGMQTWDNRGDFGACQDLLSDSPLDAKEISEACIRCQKGTKEGTQGFFVAAFVRDHPPDLPSVQGQEQEWEGFSDG